MSVVDPSTTTVIETITVGVGPLVPLATSNLIWVANRNGGTVSVIEPTP